MATETTLRKSLEQQLLDIGTELRRQAIIGHHGDQERKRLETMIEAMAIINPKQVHHLQSLQLAFQFKPRKVLPSVVPEDGTEEGSVGGKQECIFSEESVDGKLDVGFPEETSMDLAEEENKFNAPLFDRSNELSGSSAVTATSSVVLDVEGHTGLRIDAHVEEQETAEAYVGDLKSEPQETPRQNLLRASEINSDLGCEALSRDDRLLLLRTKWLMARFENWDRDTKYDYIPEKAPVMELDTTSVSARAAADTPEDNGPVNGGTAQAPQEEIVGETSQDVQELEAGVSNEEQDLVHGEEDGQAGDEQIGDTIENGFDDYSDGDREDQTSIEQSNANSSIVLPTFEVKPRPPIIGGPSAPQQFDMPHKEESDIAAIQSTRLLFSFVEFIRDGILLLIYLSF